MEIPWLLALAAAVMVGALVYWVRRPRRDGSAHDFPDVGGSRYPYDEPRSEGGGGLGGNNGDTDG